LRCASEWMRERMDAPLRCFGDIWGLAAFRWISFKRSEELLEARKCLQ
jgi:hypothetical protein